MRVGIVGAGVCGLAAGRTLQAAGHRATLFEKSRVPGGRAATRRSGGFVWDTGATSIAPRGKRIERVLREELDTSELIQVEKPIYLHGGLRVAPGDPRRSGTRYVYRSGIDKLGKLLAEGQDVRLGTTVDGIERDGERYRILGETFDAVLLTPPIPQSSLLLWGLGESRPLASAQYRPCLSVCIGYRIAPPDLPYHALLEPEQRHPLTWLSVESVKSPGRAPEGGSAFVAQLSAEFSQSQYALPDEDLVATVGEFLERLYGSPFCAPVVSGVVRWKYSQPIGLADFDEVNPPGSRLLVASDALLGGHIEDAYEVGCHAAERLLS